MCGRSWAAPARCSVEGGRLSTSALSLECLLIADDLTGACDAAVHFALEGLRASVCLSPDGSAGRAQVLAITTESREVESAAAASLVAGTASLLPHRSAAILFKKIDSTLRGNPSSEIAACLETFGCQAAVVCPAFPALDRIVEQGRLHVRRGADFEPVEIIGRLRAPAVEPCLHVSQGAVREALSLGARLIVLDASSDHDLDQIATELLAIDQRLLWVGSGGLACALARRIGRAKRPPAIAPLPMPVLFCVGSDHPSTAAQQAALLRDRRAFACDADRISHAEIAAALDRGKHVCLRIKWGDPNVEHIRRLIAGLPSAAFLLTGGKTASLVCRAAGVRRIDLHDEILPGVPRGTFRCGQLDGAPVVTKSGAFGDTDTFLRIADFFSCQTFPA
jgi:uncharacterized protein YgbK (DUF1537 family)